jgi:hypothetical protein
MHDNAKLYQCYSQNRLKFKQHLLQIFDFKFNSSTRLPYAIECNGLGAFNELTKQDYKTVRQIQHASCVHCYAHRLVLRTRHTISKTELHLCPALFHTLPGARIIYKVIKKWVREGLISRRS